MGRQKLGEFIRKLKYVNAIEDGEDDCPGQLLQEFEDQYREDITLAELKDGYKAFQEKVCVPKFGYRHSPDYWAAYTTCCVLERLNGYHDEEEANQLVLGHCCVDTWVALVKAGPNSAHIDLMSKLNNNMFEQYLKECKKAELDKIFQQMKVKFSYDSDDTDLDETSYGSFLYNAIRELFRELSLEQLQSSQGAFLDLYLFYNNQMNSLSPELTTYVGYIVRDMPDNLVTEDENGRDIKNPYLGFKDVKVIKTHISALQEILLAFTGDVEDANLDDLLGFLIQAAVMDDMLDSLFDCFMELCIKFIGRENPPDVSKKILDEFRIKLFRKIKESEKQPSNTIVDSGMKALKVLLGHVKDKLGKEIFLLIDEMFDACVMLCTKMSAEQTKSVLELINQLLVSGHEQLVDLAYTIIGNDNMEKVLTWKKYLDHVKVILVTVSSQPCDKMWAKRANDDCGCVIDKYDKFMGKLIETLKDLKALPKLQAELCEYTITCLEDSPPAKAELASFASRDEFLNLKKADAGFIENILTKCANVLSKEDVMWNVDMNTVIMNLLDAVINSYDGDGKAVPPAHHQKLMSLFKTCLSGDDLDDTFYPPGMEKNGGVNLWVLRSTIIQYIALHTHTATESQCVDLLPDILRWGKLAEEEDMDDVKEACYNALQLFCINTPPQMADVLPQLMELFLNPKNMGTFYLLVSKLYPANPDPVHKHLPALVNKFAKLKEAEKALVLQLINTVAMTHPEVLTDQQVTFLFQNCKQATPEQQMVYLSVLLAIAKKHPEKVQPHFSTLLDNGVFHDKSLMIRIPVIGCTAARNEKLGQQGVDYFVGLINHQDPTTVQQSMNQLSYMVRHHKDYMQKYRAHLEKLEKSSTVPDIQQSAHNIIQVLEGKSYEDVFKGLQEQQELTSEMDKKLDVTIQTVLQTGEQVTKQHYDIRDIRRDVDDIDEKVEDIDKDLEETKVKVEEIDNKTMTNAPKWSRDLTKLMNPKAEADWRLLASRLGYSNDDIRAWSQQHDPCMALLSEWYAVRKTSEANHAVLTALTEMNRLDGAVIVENAMKASEDVVEDEDYEYPSPPSVFLSYQWGVQPEVKLLNQHLNMAGYECWMDIGQMGGGDKLFAKIDNGIRAAKVIICCVTEKYAQSPNCNREVNLAVSLGKQIIPLLMEKMSWPPKGAMGPIFSEYLFIRFFGRPGEKVPPKCYWPVAKMQELLMQMNYTVPPEQSLIKKEYHEWWLPIVEDIVIEKKDSGSSAKPNTSAGKAADSGPPPSPDVFLSYQWDKQTQVKILYQRLCSQGYTVWMDIFQMGGGDSLYDKIDRGVRGCKVVVTCVTPKYALSANCRREVSLADAIKRPIVPLLLEQMKWPPDGPMSMVFTELLYINMYKDPNMQTTWKGPKFEELNDKVRLHLGIEQSSGNAKNDGSDQKPKSESSKAPPKSADDKKGSTGPVKSAEPTVQASEKKEEAKKTSAPTSYSTNSGQQKPSSDAAAEKPKSKSCSIL